MDKATLTDVIQFNQRSPAGAATIEFPAVCGCPHCGGLTGVRFNDEFIADPELALQVDLIVTGYNLRMNEEAARRGAFKNHNGHDGWPEDWQAIQTSTPCECKAVEAKE